jgi:hypothetical protein
MAQRNVAFCITELDLGGAERALIADLAGGDEGLLRQYQQGLTKFEQLLEPVCQAGATTVFRVGRE